MSRLSELILLVMLLCAPHICAQEATDTLGGYSLSRFLHGVRYSAEVQASFSDGQTPLWLNANKHGLSSLEKQNGYMRAALFRPLSADSLRNWGLGYALDMAVASNYTSDLVVQQAYAEGRWKHGTLTIGSKNWPMELKNNNLSSGSQTHGINARPVPQIRLALADYWTLPFGKQWLHFKGHIAYGWMTDDNWQHSFTRKQSKYADDVLYHSKAGYLKIGNKGSRIPLSLELGLEMAATFSGTCYVRDYENGGLRPMKGEGWLRGAWDALIPAGSDAGETVYKNIAGNQVGSWVMRVNYEREDWSIHLYADKYFEDHSGMFYLDYDGYGNADEWNKHKDWRFMLYDFKDIMLGTELNLHHGSWLRNVVFEYLYTKYQSGPIYHDHNKNIADHIGGVDNYYNHYIFTGWQHWGQAMGNPLYRSPIYNEDGTIEFKGNRFYAFHLGLAGAPSDYLSWRLLCTWQKGYGTYQRPYTSPQENLMLMAEADYHFPDYTALKGWSVRLAYGMDRGKTFGNNYGGQLTIVKTGLLNSQKKKTKK